MSRNEAVSPLRINKTPTASPTKSRPLSEIAATSGRRNSPSYNQATKSMMFAKESSPFRDSSPFTNSPRLFWKEQTVSPKARFGSENEVEQEVSLSPKRNSIENLKKASRVKNSSMFAREQRNEYDPASVHAFDRPLAAGRPLSTQVQGNAYGGSGLAGLRKQNDEFTRGHRRGESMTKIPTLSPSKVSQPKFTPTYSSPTKDRQSPGPEGRASPTKSSLISNGRFNTIDYDNSSFMSDDDEMKHQTPRALRRHAKSVTFDVAPPTINEYEMVTPDPSVSSVTSGSREGSYESQEEDMSFDQDDSFDASLEDTDKTPVVLPEDWRHMSPEAANTSLASTFDDPFDGRENSPMPTARPNGSAKANTSRHGSTTSDGENRPLPPLPGMQASNDRQRRESSSGLSAVAERASNARRSLPQLPQASFSKDDLLTMREGSMSLEDRLRLMNFDEERNTATPTQETQDKKTELGFDIQVDVAELDEVTESEITFDAPKAPRISRESILRKVKSRNFEEYESYNYDAEFSPERSYGDLADLDPDVPIPSRECSSNFDEIPRDREAAENRDDDVDSVLDAYSMGETTEMFTEISQLEDYERDSSVVHHQVKHEPHDEDDASEYSPQPEEQPTSQSTIDSSGPSTPTAFTSSPTTEEKEARRNQLFSSLNENNLNLHLDPLKQSFETAASPLDTAPKIGEMREFLRRPETPDAEDMYDDEPGTPDSVIRHPLVIEPQEQQSLEVPEQMATIKGAGGKLKTRPSLLGCDLESMAATRRSVSGERPPPVPVRSPKRQSLSLDIHNVEEGDSQTDYFGGKENLMLDLSIGDESNDLSFGLDREFDNIIEAQKVALFPLPSFAQFPTSSAAHEDGASHMSGEGFVYRYSPANGYVREQKGYLMRQNTKVVVASSRNFSDEKPPSVTEGGKPAKSAQSSPRKTSAERKPAWTTEPWNGKARRRSIRTTSGARRAAAAGPAPPLPGQESAVAGGLDSVGENDDEEFEDGAERGRLFVKVIGVKDLDLPLPKTERTWFQLTLDNGLHCVTTSWLELGHSAPIGQEFELVVLDDLEFQLTLQTKLEPPAQPQVVASPVKTVNHKKSHSAFRNFLSSPKKRKEQERKDKEEAERMALQQQKEVQAQQNHQTTAWDLLHDLVGPDGSFARAYVCLKNHENQAYGRPLVVDIPCFNEWAVDDTGVSSVKSKRGGVVRRPPYRVGKLQLQLLYVPKPKNAKDEDMPKSMNACIRELKEAEEISSKNFEGALSQQGGDCPYWRRRFFRLSGTKLTAYHEATRQPRATINLAKATKLIDDKSALKQSSKTKSGGRRKSAFAEDEEGYMFVEEGFRIRFANGEVIDFYADTAAQKDEWMKVLSDCVGKDVNGGKGWADMVLEKERKEKSRASQYTQAKALKEAPNMAQHPSSRPRSQPERRESKSAPNSPAKPKHARTQSHAPLLGLGPPPPLEKDARHKASTAPRSRESGSNAERRNQVRSMIF